MNNNRFNQPIKGHVIGDRCLVCIYATPIPWGKYQYKDRVFNYGDSHCEDKLVVRLSYPYDGNPFTGKTATLC